MAAFRRRTSLLLIAFAAVSAYSILLAPRAAEMTHPLPTSGVASLA
jgi:hypothetical protein